MGARLPRHVDRRPRLQRFVCNSAAYEQAETGTVYTKKETGIRRRSKCAADHAIQATTLECKIEETRSSQEPNHRATPKQDRNQKKNASHDRRFLPETQNAFRRSDACQQEACVQCPNAKTSKPQASISNSKTTRFPTTAVSFRRNSPGTA